MDSLELNRVFHDHECAYYDQRFAIGHDERSARRAAAELAGLLGRPVRTDERVLDVGCGTGWFAAGLRRAGGRDVTGLDLSAGMLGRARRAGAWPLAQADAGRLPIRSGSVDLVVARGVLHHLADVAGALGEWRRVLVPGGAVALASEPTPAAGAHATPLVRALLAVLRRPLPPDQHCWELASIAANLHVFTLDRLAGAAREAGFDSVRLTTTGFAGTLALTASYVVQGRAGRPAGRLPWGSLERLGWRLDRLVFDRLLPPSRRHTVAGVLTTAAR
jgi:ubiquinone/menaquinone biosynthesis C-methylase UbiE